MAHARRKIFKMCDVKCENAENGAPIFLDSYSNSTFISSYHHTYIIASFFNLQMAEAFLQILIENLGSLIQKEIGLIIGADKEMKKLQSTLTTIQSVLEDAETKRLQSKPIQNWLSKLNHAALVIDDILDECITEISRFERRGGKFKFLKKILFRRKIGRKIRGFSATLDNLAAERLNFHLREVVTEEVDCRRDTGSVLIEPDHVIGRDEDREKIVNMLVNQVADCEHLSVLPILGVGGLGKTTLAQLVFNDLRVTQHFHTKLWVCVSDNFDLKILLEAMIVSATGSPSNLVQLDALQRRLIEELNHKRYLLVLDDVWNENQENWAHLKSILACGSKGASILVSTRLGKVADIMGTLPTHFLHRLSGEDLWLLFKLRAFGNESEAYPNLEVIGRQIVKKCAGVPLAAKALGGLLRFKRKENEWIDVKESEIWDLPEEETMILPALRLSYHHLPLKLKRCFAYCSVFAKDFAMEKQDLIFHWMAHGCISSNGVHEAEDVGDQIWNELVLRSFFEQVHTIGTRTTFVMHDLLHDLAQSVMKSRVPEVQSRKSGIDASRIKVRNACFINSSYYINRSSSITIQVSSLTTIMNYTRLRILKLNGERVKKLPSTIGKLKHMRYVDLTNSDIHSLPHTFCNLWNLQVLILKDCHYLESLPKHIIYMTNLRHIFLDRCFKLRDMPSRIGELTSLQTLSLFVVGYKVDNQVDQLELLNLGGRLEIRHLEKTKSHMSAKKANLIEKSKLRDLVLCWGDDRGGGEELAKTMDEKVVEALEPHSNLEKLEISGYKGSHFPLWMTKMKNLTDVTLQYCKNCSNVPLGNLLCLKFLFLKNVDGLEYIMDQGSFPSLENLRLIRLPNLKGLVRDEEVHGEVMFPNLQELLVLECEMLKLPAEALPNLERLNLTGCSPMTVSSAFSKAKLQNLTYLHLDLSKIKTMSLIEDTREGLCSLRELSIYNAGEQHLPEKWFRGLVSLKALLVGRSLVGRWLQQLTALEELYVCDCDCSGIELAEQIKHLPLLKCLKLQNLPNVVSLPQGLQQLESLTLSNLPQLTSLPELLPDLKCLDIQHCPSLASLPANMPSITSLLILHCPQLLIRCQKDKGEDWHKISHIPQLNIYS